MQVKWVFGIGIVVAFLASLYFIIQLNFGYVVLTMVALFSLTNGARAKSFQDQGLEREAKWMRWMALFFGVTFIVLLIFTLVS
ncbi:hypothetical protein [Sporosarcina beigongshangi]|uniref:hypothetical protein n=1 Tax=Sporosarcina beigongshangi TaxID=2782538 RepID=UPI00193A8139|nr:hypothetical protein [Sporosarcina beigongshangi]